MRLLIVCSRSFIILIHLNRLSWIIVPLGAARVARRQQSGR